MRVTILGNNSALPNHDRFPTAQILTVGNEHFLIDCGEGTQVRMLKNKIKHNKISKIFISHLHGDHYFGLIGLLTRYSLNNRIEPIDLYGPAALIEIINLQLRVANSKLSYELNFHPLNFSSPEVILDNDVVEVIAFPTEHRIECYGFRFVEKNFPRKIDKDKISKFNIPFDYYKKLQQGLDYIDSNNNLIKNGNLTIEGIGNKVYSYCADTRYTESFLELIQASDLLYHETTYLKDQSILAKERFHSTTVDAANIAKKSNAKKLIIGHFSSKYTDLDLFLSEVQQIFPSTLLSYEGLTVDL